MKKRSFITLLAVIFCVTLAAGIAACRSGGSGGSGNTHIHSYSDKWSCDAEYHWHENVCYHSADEEVPVADKAPHEYEDGVCKVCKYIDDLLIVPQSRKLIEDKIAPVLFADRDEKTILSQNWQLITDNKNEYLTGLAATYIYATEEHTHVVNIDTISFTKFSLENLVGAKFTEFDKDSIKTENKKSLTASLIKTWEVNADEQRKAEALKNLSVADGYENTVRTLFADADGDNFLLECNAGTTRINSSSYADTKIEGRQVSELEYTVREHKYTTDNLCAATDCGYDGLEYKEIEGGYAITGTGELDKSKLKILNLSPTHRDKTVKKIGNDAFSGCTNLETVRIIGNNNAYIEEIGSRAFEGCERLYDFAWQKSLTSIGYDAFKGCVSLYRVQLEGTPQIGSDAFSGCKKIIEVYCMYNDLTEGSSSYGGIASYAKHVYGPNIEGHNRDSSQVWKSVNGDSEPFAGATFIFYNDTKEKKDYLIGLDGGSFNFTTTDKLILPKKLAYLGYSTEKYEVYDYAFAHFDEIKSVEIPESATAVASTAFDGCDNLESIETAEENTAYASQDGILYNKNKTQIIFVPKAIKGAVTIPTDVTSIGEYAFRDCTAEIKWGDNPSIKEIGQYAFSGYKGKSITIPDRVTSIGYKAFENCKNLTGITIPSSVTSIGEDAFYGCTKLESVYITDIAAWCNIDFGLYDAKPLLYAHNLYLDNQLVTELTAEMLQGVTEIKAYAFAGFGGTSITIPNSVTSIGSCAFYNCTSLESVTIPDSVTSIGSNAFNGCKNLEGVYINDIAAWCNIDFGSETANPLSCAQNLSRNLYLKGNLVTNLKIPQEVTQIKAYAFSGCTAKIKWENNSSIQEIGKYAFYEYKGTSVTIGNGVTSIGDSAFEDCKKLESVYIPDSVTSIGRWAFEDCEKLESVYITDIAAWCNIDFGSETANPLYCAQNLYLNNQLVTKLTAEMLQGVTTIKKCAFYNYERLTSITIPNSVTSIGYKAFCNCDSLTSVTFTNPNGWYRTLYYYGSSPESYVIPSEYLQNPQTAAEYLKDTYEPYYWERKS